MPVRNFLRDWGIELVYMISGAIGGLMFISKKVNRRRPMWEKFLIVLIGIVTANYLTPLAVWLLGIPENVHNGIAFIIGYMGLNTVGFTIDWVREKLKKK